MEYWLLMGGALISWSGKKNCTVSTSTTEAKYVALGHALGEQEWIHRFFNEIESGETMELVLNDDNKSSLPLTKNLEANKLTKLINVRHHLYESWSTKRNSLSPGYPARTWWPINSQRLSRSTPSKGAGPCWDWVGEGGELLKLRGSEKG